MTDSINKERCMTNDIYRYQFREGVLPEDIDASLLLAIWGCEALHGETQTRLDAGHIFDPDKLTCVIDATTHVGRDLNRLFVGFVRREIGDDDFHVERVETAVTAAAA
jgi:hypothetical protein